LRRGAGAGEKSAMAGRSGKEDEEDRLANARAELKKRKTPKYLACRFTIQRQAR